MTASSGQISVELTVAARESHAGAELAVVAEWNAGLRQTGSRFSLARSPSVRRFGTVAGSGAAICW